MTTYDICSNPKFMSWVLARSGQVCQLSHIGLASGLVDRELICGQQKRFALYHCDPLHLPSLKSKSHCSLRTIRNAIIADKIPTIVTTIHPRLRSITFRSRPRSDLRFRSLKRRLESLICMIYFRITRGFTLKRHSQRHVTNRLT